MVPSQPSDRGSASSSNTPVEEPPQSLRKRAKKACESCRKRKRRCDGGQPCRSCVEYEYDCYYADPPSGEQSRSTTVLSHLEAATGQRPPYLDNQILAQGSVVVFPQMLAHLAYERTVPVRYDFGYNVGMPGFEDARDPMSESLTNAMSFEAARRFCRKYSDSCHTLFPVVEPDVLTEQLRKISAPEQSREANLPAELAVTFAVLLGSYFSWPLLADRHDALLLHAEQELDRLTFRYRSPQGRWLLQAWILKTLLLRSSSSPDLAWLSSCNMIHVAELVQPMVRQTPASSRKTDMAVPQPDHALFDLAWTLHQLISFDSGRSTTSLAPICCREDDTTPVTDICHIQEIFQRLQKSEAIQSGPAAKVLLMEICSRHIGSNISLGLHGLVIEACILCGLYRQMYQEGTSLESKALSVMKSIFESALTAAETITRVGEPWFTLIELPSQLACVCLALGRPVLDLLPRTLALVGGLTRLFRSETLKETENTISALLGACLRARNDDTSTIRRSLEYLSQTAGADASAPVVEEEWTRYLNQQVFD